VGTKCVSKTVRNFVDTENYTICCVVQRERKVFSY
jgi:hypothetical protein